MTLPAQQFGRAFVDAFGMLAALEAAMVEKELQQGQVVWAQVSAQEEVAAQSAIDVLDDRTGAYDMVRHVTHGFAQVVEMVAEVLPQRRFLVPAQRVTAVAGLQVKQLRDDVDGDLELAAQVSQAPVECGGEDQQQGGMAAQQCAHRRTAVGTPGTARLQV